jgi:hypothetical protein
MDPIFRVTTVGELGTLAETSNRSTLPYGATFQKTAFFKVTAMNISNLFISTFLANNIYFCQFLNRA